MVIDSSALIAILLGEPHAAALASAIVADPKRLISAFTALESVVVIETRKGPAGGREFDLLVHKTKIEIVPLTADHFALAREAYARYGKGRHPAGLNLGDCCSYALARYSGEPLLFVGDDFSKTDMRIVS
jgi:ribonuclease VapC